MNKILSYRICNLFIVQRQTTLSSGNFFQKAMNSNLTISQPEISQKNSNLKIYKINSPFYRKILTGELKFLSDLFAKNNFKLKIAGGAVRDLLIEIEPNDVDLATDALPDQMIEMFKKAQIRILNLKGLDHGTVPVRIDKVTFYKVNIYK